jgi:hypothetical protein
LIKIIRPSKSGYITFGCIAGVPMIIGIVAAFKSISALWIVGICLLGMITAWMWISTYEIRISDKEIIFKSFFGGTRSMKITEVDNAKITRFSYQTQKEILGPPNQLRVFPHFVAGLQAISINAKVFSRKDLKYLVEFLKKKETGV